MADQKTHSVQEFSGLLKDILKAEAAEWETVLRDLRRKELAKADDGNQHYEPGNHEAASSGVAPHMEPGNHEDHAFGPGAQAEQKGTDPVGSDTGIPMDGQPENSTPGGEICPMCNQPDLPGKCQCLAPATPKMISQTDGFDSANPALGADADLGGTALALSERKSKPVTGDEIHSGALHTKVLHHESHPHGHYHVEDHGAGVHGVLYTSKRAKKAQYIATTSSIDGAKTAIRAHVDGKFGSHKMSKDEVHHGAVDGFDRIDKDDMGDGEMGAGDGGADMAMAEKCEKCSLEKTLCKCMQKDMASAVAGLKQANANTAAGNQARAAKGFGQPKPFTKEEWIDIANEGDPVKRLQGGDNDTAVPASTNNKGAKKRGQGVDIKRVASADDSEIRSEVQKDEMEGDLEQGEKTHVCNAPMCTKGISGKSDFCKAHQPKDIKKAAVPMAKPPSGASAGTAVPQAKVASPKLPGASIKPPAPKAAPKLPGMGMKPPKAPAMGSMIQVGSGTPAGTIKSEPSVPEKHKAKIAAQDKKMPEAMRNVMSPKKDIKKAVMAPGHKQMMSQHANQAATMAAHPAPAAAPAPKMPSAHEDAQRASMYADFMPKAAAPSTPGLTAPPRLPGMGKPTAKPAAKPFMGKSEMGDCSMCKAAEHPGKCK